VNDLQSLETFRGVARLFPLPNLVLFPSVVQPLHIFEPRYRQMMSDALDDDRLMALVLLQPGWEEEYEQRPPVYPVACLGRIFNEQRLADGRYNLLLHGLRRIRIEQELPPDRLYRQAQVQLLEEEPLNLSSEAEQLRVRLQGLLMPVLESQGGAVDQARQLLDSDLPLGMLCDIFSFALPLETGLKQELLEELHVGRRAARLLAELEQLQRPQPPEGRTFPPEFSSN
jgi:Lon protease-like protein